MGAKDMAKVMREEWVSGTTTLKVSSVSQISLAITELEELLIQGKPPVKVPAKKDQEYDRTSYFASSTNVKDAFQKLYTFCYNLAKPEGSRNIDMETSVAFWTVLLVPKYPLMGEVVQFINEKGTYKATNKDLWTMMLEFCENVTPNLEGYDPEAAWPTLVDDFVAWKKSESGNGHSADMNAD
jgi:DCN1-like protein 4/5